MHRYSTAMSLYIGEKEIALYDKYADGHIGRLDARRQIIIPFLRKHNLHNILEMGPGPGNSTFDLITSLPVVHITAVDIDQLYLRYAQKKLKLYSQRVKCINEDIRNFSSSTMYDAFIALGAFTDVSSQAKQRITLLQKIRKNLLRQSNSHKGGRIVLEEELLPTTGVRNRTQALWKHHGNVMLAAILRNEFETAYLELKALVSGLKHLGDHKTTLSELISELKTAGYVGVSWKKVWPLPQHRIADTSMVITKQAGRHNAKIWDYYAGLILVELLQTQPRYNKLEVDPYFQQAVLLLKQFHQRIRQCRGFVYQKDYENRLAKQGLTFVCGEEAPRTVTDPDNTGGVYVIIGHT